MDTGDHHQEKETKEKLQRFESRFSNKTKRNETSPTVQNTLIHG